MREPRHFLDASGMTITCSLRTSNAIRSVPSASGPGICLARGALDVGDLGRRIGRRAQEHKVGVGGKFRLEPGEQRARLLRRYVMGHDEFNDGGLVVVFRVRDGDLSCTTSVAP